MNAPNLSRRLATRIIEGLKGRGRILVVKGGSSALIRAVDDAISGFVSPIADRFEHEVFSGDNPKTHEAITELSERVAHTLFSSEHLEDVFADRRVVEREVFDAARVTFQEESEDERAHVLHVELDLLGYVAATAGKLAAEELVVVALERAGALVGAQLSTYVLGSREAIFVPGPDTFPDLRLELEEAVADELCSLVTSGAVVLPVLERTRPLLHRVDPASQSRLVRVIDRVAMRTLRRTGCSARWELPDDRSLRVVFTPLSEQDAREVDAHVSAFATEVDAVLRDVGAKLVMAAVLPVAESRGAEHHNGNGSVAQDEPEPESDPLPVVGAKRAVRAGGRAKAPPRVAPKRTTPKRTTKRAEASVEKPTTRKTASGPGTTKRAAATKKPGAGKKA